jgi:hypothetical protein
VNDFEHINFVFSIDAVLLYYALCCEWLSLCEELHNNFSPHESIDQQNSVDFYEGKKLWGHPKTLSNFERATRTGCHS